MHPLRTPSGRVLTVDSPADHPWHHGLWSTVKFVNGVNFWEEVDEHGVVRVDEATTTPDGVRWTISWVRPDGAVALHEERTIAESPVPVDGANALSWTFALTAPDVTVLDRTPFTTWGGYGGLTFRGAPSFTDTMLLTADGERHRRLLGVPGPWCGLDGTVDGEDVGVLLVDHPANAADPVPWYASTKAATYGSGWANFVNAAFLWDGPVTLAPAETLTRRYLVAVHDGRWDAPTCAAVHQWWSST